MEEGLAGWKGSRFVGRKTSLDHGTMGPVVDSCTPDASISPSAVPGLREAVVWDVISVRAVK
jgi:hypothetical protein